MIVKELAETDESNAARLDLESDLCPARLPEKRAADGIRTRTILH
jgi:hypothetical protein